MANRQLDEEAIFHVARGITDLELSVDYLDKSAPATRLCASESRRCWECMSRNRASSNPTMIQLPPQSRRQCPRAPDSRLAGTSYCRRSARVVLASSSWPNRYVPIRRKVALKIIKPGMDTNAVVARFEAERQALALMDHPNIARVLDGGPRTVADRTSLWNS